MEPQINELSFKQQLSIRKLIFFIALSIALKIVINLDLIGKEIGAYEKRLDVIVMYVGQDYQRLYTRE